MIENESSTNLIYSSLWLKGSFIEQDGVKCSVESFLCVKLVYVSADSKVYLKRYFSAEVTDPKLFIKDVLTFSVNTADAPFKLTHSMKSDNKVYF